MRCITQYGCQLNANHENKDYIGEFSVWFSERFSERFSAEFNERFSEIFSEEFRDGFSY